MLKFLEEEIQSFEKLFEELNGESCPFQYDKREIVSQKGFRAKERWRPCSCYRNPLVIAVAPGAEAKANLDQEGGKAKNSAEAKNPSESGSKTQCAFQSPTK